MVRAPKCFFVVFDIDESADDDAILRLICESGSPMSATLVRDTSSKAHRNRSGICRFYEVRGLGGSVYLTLADDPRRVGVQTAPKQVRREPFCSVCRLLMRHGAVERIPGLWRDACAYFDRLDE